MNELKQAWEYSFIHSSATGRGDEEIGPCLTYDKASAFGKGCIKQREVFICTQPEATKDDSLRTTLADLAMTLWRTHYRNDSPNFELLPDPAGILSQIDNMVSGLVKPEATKPAPIPGLPFADLATPIKEFEARKAAALASPADALVAGDRVDWREFLADACIECEIPDSKYESLCIAINAAIQAQKDGHK